MAAILLAVITFIFVSMALLWVFGAVLLFGTMINKLSQAVGNVAARAALHTSHPH